MVPRNTIKSKRPVVGVGKKQSAKHNSRLPRLKNMCDKLLTWRWQCDREKHLSKAPTKGGSLHGQTLQRVQQFSATPSGVEQKLGFILSCPRVLAVKTSSLTVGIGRGVKVQSPGMLYSMLYSISNDHHTLLCTNSRQQKNYVTPLFPDLAQAWLRTPANRKTGRHLRPFLHPAAHAFWRSTNTHEQKKQIGCSILR